jgi:hypothetical protein
MLAWGIPEPPSSLGNCIIFEDLNYYKKERKLQQAGFELQFVPCSQYVYHTSKLASNCLHR